MEFEFSRLHHADTESHNHLLAESGGIVISLITAPITEMGEKYVRISINYKLLVINVEKK